MKQIQSVAVFCGSKSGNNPLFEGDTAVLGKLLADARIKIIYGGGNIGLMGTVANAALANGGIVIGIIPKVLIEWEREHKGLTELTVTDDMHQRKKLMYERCDAAIILPGGYGTLDELFEMLTWNQLNIHNKKIYLLNSGNYYRHLASHINEMYKEGFLYENPETRVHLSNTPEELIKELLQMT
jgi:uncharacterized protein (TIGR00730 family)